MGLKALQVNRETPLNILFGTDWWSDCDDVAALDIMLKAHRRGVIALKAIGVNSVMRYSAPSVKALCEQYALADIPIGLQTSAARKGLFCLYQKKLASVCRSDFTNEDCPEAYKLYRRVLSSLQGKAVIADVGFPTLIKELLASPPDEYSDLIGTELVKEKVDEIIVMGGRWDKPVWKEYNFSAYALNREAAAYLCEHCPVPLTFLGYEVGKTIRTGGKSVAGLTGTAYAAHLSAKGRPSWDPMTALYAILGDAETAGYKRVCGTASVNPATGKNTFHEHGEGNHAYLVKIKDDCFYQTQIEEVLHLALEEE